MKYTVFFLAALILTMLALPMGVMAQEDCPKGEGNHEGCEMAGDCPYMVDGKCTYEGECPYGCMSEGEMPMGQECPGMEGMPMERPWHEGRPENIWRHMDDSALNHEAMMYMGNVRTILILPFADYTAQTYEGEPMLSDAGGPMRLVDNLAGAFMSRGYLVVPPRDAEAAYNDLMSPNRHWWYEDGDNMTPETENNSLYFSQMPDRSMAYYESVVPGLDEQATQVVTGGSRFLKSEDIVNLAGMFAADAVVRGFVNEYAITKDIDADWRTLIPPFLGLLNPDKRVTIEISYYLYDGHSGQLLWNDTVEMQKNSDWPIFNSDDELLRGVEHDVILSATDSILPNWQDMVWGHPEWVPFEMWEGMSPGEMGRYAPDWVNPNRDGWHEEYLDKDWVLDLGNPEMLPPWLRNRDFSHNYNAYRQYLESQD